MDPIEIAKDAIRVIGTAGLSKDVIDLLDKKVLLLASELDIANKEIVRLQSENANLKTENAQLKKQLDDLRPISDRKPSDRYKIEDAGPSPTDIPNIM